MAPLASTSDTTRNELRDPRGELAHLITQVEGVLARIQPDEVLARHAPQMWDLCDRGAKLFAGAQVLLARRVDDAAVHKQIGVKTTSEYLALRSGLSNAAAAEMVATSSRLRSLPSIEAAVRAGCLSATQTHRVADAAAHDPGEEQRLLGLATKVSLKELSDEALRVKAAADPNPEATRRRHRRERYFRQGTRPDGAWWFSGRGTPEDAGQFNAALNPLLENIFRQARSQGRHEPRDAYAYDAVQQLACHIRGDSGPAHAAGERPCSEAHPTEPPAASEPNTPGGTESPSAPERPTTPEARRPTSLSLLPVLRLDLAALRRGRLVAGELCEITGIGPIAISAASELLDHSIIKLVLTHQGDVVSVTHIGRTPADPTHLALLRADITALADHHTAPDDDTCTLPTLGTVTTGAARELLGELTGQDLLAQVLARGRDVADLVHLGRQPTVAQRVASLWAQPTCSVEGCPHTFTQIDHRYEWHKNQETRLANLDRLCGHHHRLKTTRNYQLTSGTGDRAFVPPTDPRHPEHGQQSSRTGRAPPQAA